MLWAAFTCCLATAWSILIPCLDLAWDILMLCVVISGDICVMCLELAAVIIPWGCEALGDCCSATAVIISQRAVGLWSRAWFPVMRLLHQVKQPRLWTCVAAWVNHTIANMKVRQDHRLAQFAVSARHA